MRTGVSAGGRCRWQPLSGAGQRLREAGVAAVDQLEPVAERVPGVEAADRERRLVVARRHAGGIEPGTEAGQVIDQQRDVRLAPGLERLVDPEVQRYARDRRASIPPRSPRAAGLGTSVSPSSPP